MKATAASSYIIYCNTLYSILLVTNFGQEIGDELVGIRCTVYSVVCRIVWCVGTSPPKIQILGPLIEVRVMFIGGSKNKKQKRSENSVVAHTPSSEELTSY